jgi:hypothetical protein
VPVGTFLEWQARRDGLTRLEAYDATSVTLSGDGPARRLSATSATSGLLDMLGVTPALGRVWTTDEAASRVVVVSHQFWQGQLLGDSAVIGRELVISGQTFASVGVLPPTFSFALNVSDLWLPSPVRAGGDGQPLRVIGRLAAGATPASVALALDVAQRTQELALRLALGAETGKLRRSVCSRTLS